MITPGQNNNMHRNSEILWCPVTQFEKIIHKCYTESIKCYTASKIFFFNWNIIECLRASDEEYSESYKGKIW